MHIPHEGMNVPAWCSRGHVLGFHARRTCCRCKNTKHHIRHHQAQLVKERLWYDTRSTAAYLVHFSRRCARCRSVEKAPVSVIKNARMTPSVCDHYIHTYQIIRTQHVARVWEEYFPSQSNLWIVRTVSIEAARVDDIFSHYTLSSSIHGRNLWKRKPSKTNVVRPQTWTSWVQAVRKLTYLYVAVRKLTYPSSSPVALLST